MCRMLQTSKTVPKRIAREKSTDSNSVSMQKSFFKCASLKLPFDIGQLCRMMHC
jgi:hypothetical protein